MQFVLLKFFNPAVESGNGCKHLIVLLFITVAFLLCLIAFRMNPGHFAFEFLHLHLVVIQRLFELSSCCYSLKRKSLFAFHFIGQARHLSPQIRVVSVSLPHLIFCLIEFTLNQVFLFGFFPKHTWQQFGVLSNLLQVLCQLTLVLNCLLQFWLVH